MKTILTLTDKDITGSDKLSRAEPRIAVNAVLFNSDGHIALFYMGRYDLYTLPGGGVEPGEDLIDAVKREVREETGCECDIIGELGMVYENRAEHDFTQERSYYLARVAGDTGGLKLSDAELAAESEIVWQPLGSALKMIAESRHDNYQRKFIQKRDIAALTEALAWLYLHDIPSYGTFAKIEPITKGWSEDKKYCVTNTDGEKYLLRISPIERYETRKALFNMLEQVAALGISMCLPIEFGTCAAGVYSLQSWIDGEDLDAVLPLLSETEQYVLGLKSGEILRKMHSIPAPDTQEEWALRFNKKIDRNIALNKKCEEEGFAVDGLEHLHVFVQNNRYLLKNRPQCFQHGDYHVGNMMMEQGELKIIDFDRHDFGDPWEEFNRMTFNAEASPHFATGQLHGYFGGEPPLDFFRFQAFYIASTHLGGLYWARKFGESEVIFIKKQIANILCWFGNMNNPVPTWYLKDFYIQYIDGVPFKLKSPFDFSFLSKYGTFAKIEPITKGWSEDKKYCVTNTDGEKYLLRISPIERYETRKALFNMLEQVAALGIPMCLPIEFGTCADGVYSLQSWIDGEDLDAVLPLLSETEQYVLGLQAGEALRKIHSLPAPTTAESWASRVTTGTTHMMENYRNCGVRFPNDQAVIEYVTKNISLVESRPQTFQHGDFSTSNMMLENGSVRIIDFDYSYGDPWQDFESIRWSVDKSKHFATGQIKGYFGDDALDDFWSLLKFYLAQGCFHNIPWSVNTGEQEQIDTSIRHAQDIVEWFDGFINPVPTWYLKDFYIQWIDGVPYKLKSPFDFSFLSKYGKVFKVFDHQGSGNICFGITDGEKRYFVKFAGAPTENYSGAPQDAIERLKRAVPAYRDLAHPNLIKLIKDEEIGNGYAVIFEWVDAVHMWTPDGGQAFKGLPLETHLDIFEEILTFHAYMAEKEYCALDFYEDHIMWDAKNKKTVICDIDFYSKGWYEGGSCHWNTDCEWYSPEQFIDGAAIDEVSCVYVMGATAFALFGGGRDRSIEKWRLNRALYHVANKAVQKERDKRQQTIEQLIEEWSAAK